MHVSSGKLLSAKRKIGEDDEETWSLKLNPDGSKKAYFKVVPHKFKSEGDKVFNNLFQCSHDDNCQRSKLEIKCA
jgi:hypothetical protein